MSKKSKIAYAIGIITLLVGNIFVMYEFEFLDVDEFIDDILYPYYGPVYNRTGKIHLVSILTN